MKLFEQESVMLRYKNKQTKIINLQACMVTTEMGGVGGEGGLRGREYIYTYS